MAANAGYMRTPNQGNQFKEQSILDIKTHFKPTETFQHTSSHPPGVK